MNGDRQLVAFAGEPNGRIVLVDWRQPPGQNHRVIRPADNHDPVAEHVGDIRYRLRKLTAWERTVHFFTGNWPGDVYQDSLKISGCHNLRVYAETVEGGVEDVVDIMRSHNCVVNIRNAYSRGRFVSTVKGESKDCAVYIAHQHGHGNVVDHDVGNRANVENGNTERINYNVDAFGETVTVRLLRAKDITFDGGPFKAIFPWPKPVWLHNALVWVLNKTGF